MSERRERTAIDERQDVLIECTGDHGLSDEPAFQRLRAEGWAVLSVILVAGRGRGTDRYRVLLGRSGGADMSAGWTQRPEAR